MVYFTDFVGLLTALRYECVADDVEGMVTVAKLEMTDEKWLFILVFFILLMFLLNVCVVLICLCLFSGVGLNAN